MAKNKYTWEKRQKEMARKKKKKKKQQRRLERQNEPADSPLTQGLPESGDNDDTTVENQV